MARAFSFIGSILILLVTLSAQAEIILTATLTTDQEVTIPILTTILEEPRPEPFGTATFVLNDDETALFMTATIFNIDVTGAQTPDPNDNLAAAHIHAPALPGFGAGVVWGFFGLPDNDNNPDDLVLTPFAPGVGGVFTSIWNEPEGNATTLAAQLSDILGGLSYINFHTVQNPAGEIRGQLAVVQQVQEPSALALLAIALAGLGFSRRKRAVNRPCEKPTYG